jgi:hypothetical protein
MDIGIVGGTGALGSGLAVRLAAAGVRVTIGSRARERAAVRATELSERAGAPVAGAANEDLLAPGVPLAVALPFDEAAPFLESVRARLSPGAVIVDATVPVRFEGGGPRLVELPEGSGTAHLAARLPEGVSLVGALKTLPAAVLGRLETPLECDDLVYGDNAEARARVIALLARIAGLRPVDVGGLDAAATVERMSILAIGLNRRHKVKGSRWRVVGL